MQATLRTKETHTGHFNPADEKGRAWVEEMIKDCLVRCEPMTHEGEGYLNNPPPPDPSPWKTIQDITWNDTEGTATVVVEYTGSMPPDWDGPPKLVRVPRDAELLALEQEDAKRKTDPGTYIEIRTEASCTWDPRDSMQSTWAMHQWTMTCDDSRAHDPGTSELKTPQGVWEANYRTTIHMDL